MSSEPLRVLVVVNSLGFGGTERMVESLVTGLAGSRGVRFTVCTLGGAGPIGRRLRVRGVEVVECRAGGGRWLGVAREILAVARLLRGRRFDVIHSFLYRSHFATRLARLILRSRSPLISSEQCVGDNRAGALHRINGWMGALSQRVLAVSGAVRRKLIERGGISPHRVAVIHNGVRVPRPNRGGGRRLRRALGIGESEVVFLYLGRLHREKGVEVMVEALKRLAGHHLPSWKALLVGDGPERAALEAAVGASGLRARVFFAGSRGYVAPWLEASDLLVLPSREEGMPVAALEAMARGRAVLATHVGGTPEVVVDGETGLLVPSESPETLAKALEELLRNPEARVRMGAAGRKRVQNEFSIEAMLEQTYGCYEEVRTAGAPRSRESPPAPTVQPIGGRPIV